MQIGKILRFFRSLLALITLLALCAGCSGGILIFFNNTGHDLTVISYDTVGTSITYLIKSGSSHHAASPSKLAIRCKIGDWNYGRFPVVDKAYIDSKGLWLRNVKFQIETNGFIYILPPGTKTIINTLPVQPNGFPLKPE